MQGHQKDLAPFVAASSAVYKAVVEPAASIIADKRILCPGGCYLTTFRSRLWSRTKALTTRRELSGEDERDCLIFASASVTPRFVPLVHRPARTSSWCWIFSADDRAKGSGAARQGKHVALVLDLKRQ